MDKSRNYILDRLKSKKTTIEEFNYDSLMAPPLSMFLSPYDITELNSIARSLKLAAKPELRYQEIDRVMNRRGLVKFAAGTNRVVYRHPEFPDILFKVAADAVGLGDNPAEYRNQFILKPFVTKCFEISPCGTVGIFERVNPITSREEFLSVSDDVFELLNEWIIGKYVIADCGSKYFMNFGVRRGFGVVVLDYPYLYVLDGNKLYCRKPDPLSQSGKCDGIIDYDDGYNFLRCTKCGAIYKAKELEAKIENSELVLERKGEVKMKIRISGGSQNIEENVITTGSEFESSLFKKPIAATTSEPIVKVEPKVEEKKEKKKEEVKTSKKSKTVNKSVNGVSTEVIAKSPVTFSEEYKQECLDKKAKEGEEKKMEPIDIIKTSIKAIVENFNKVDKDDILSYILSNYSTYDTFRFFAEVVYRIIDPLDDDEYVEALNDDNIIKMLTRYYNSMILFDKENIKVNNGNIEIPYKSGIGLNFEEDNDLDEKTCINELNDLLTVSLDSLDLEINSGKEDVDTEYEEPDEKAEFVYNGLEFYDGIVMDVTDIYPDQNPHKIIIPVTNSGHYLPNHNKAIIAIDVLSDIELDNLQIVSKDWFDSVRTKIDSMVEDDTSDNNDEVETIIEESESPVGLISSNNSEEMDDSMKKFIEEEINTEEDEDNADDGR